MNEKFKQAKKRSRSRHCIINIFKNELKTEDKNSCIYEAKKNSFVFIWKIIS